MKLIKYLIIPFVLSIAVIAQTSFNGVGLQGVDTGRELPIQNNVTAWYRAGKGVSVQGSNVFAWADLSGNNFHLSQYNTTNQPSFIPSYTTNQLPAVYFESIGGPNRHLFCDAIGPLFSGEDKPFTIIAFVVGQTNSNSAMPISFGWGSASNTLASKKGMSINRPGSGIVSGTFMVADTNSAAIAGIAYVQSFTGMVTNRAFIYTTTYDGQNGRLYNNLVAGTNALFDTGPITVNQLTFGLARGSNGVHAAGTAGSVWRGAIIEAQLYTNWLDGTTVSNAVNDIKSRYAIPPF